MEQTGSQLGAYRLYERIGGGGFANVYVARDTRSNEVVAVKVLHPHLAQDSHFIARFRREAEALQKMPLHPNVVHLREFDQQGGTYFLAMEYLQGKDLSQILAERKRLPASEALSIATQVAQALDAAHTHGLVHRDIKPGNIKITSHGVKVMDFGITRAAEGTKLTQTGAFMGTPDYVAPEIWEGKPADIRSDIYALGVMLYEMLTGITPFHSETPAATMRRHLMEREQPTRSIRSDVPPNVDRIIMKMMAKQPEARYQTPAEVMMILQGEHVSEPSPTVLAKTTQPSPKAIMSRPSRRAASMSWAPVVAIGAGIVFVLVVLALNMSGNRFSTGASPSSVTLVSASFSASAAPTIIADPDAIVSYGTDFRKGPGFNFDTMGTLKEGQELKVLGRHTQRGIYSEENNWLEVATREGIRGWVQTNGIKLSRPFNSIPLAQQIPATPTVLLPVAVSGGVTLTADPAAATKIAATSCWSMSDNFSRAIGWGDGNQAPLEYGHVNGEYRMRITAPNSVFARGASVSGQDVSISVTARATRPGGTYGIYFMETTKDWGPNTQLYSFEIDGAGGSSLKLYRGTRATILASGYAKSQGRDRLTVERIGQLITGYVNDVLAVRVLDSTIKGGYAGLILASQSTFPVEAMFDDFFFSGCPLGWREP